MTLEEQFALIPRHGSGNSTVQPEIQLPSTKRERMSIFDAYDQEFSSLSQEINKNINELKRDTSAGATGGLIRQVDALFLQANDLIKQMEVEVRSHDASTKKILNEKVMQYKKSTSSQRSDFERVKEQAQRSSLIGDKSAEQRQRLLDTNDKYGILILILKLAS